MADYSILFANQGPGPFTQAMQGLAKGQLQAYDIRQRQEDTQRQIAQQQEQSAMRERQMALQEEQQAAVSRYKASEMLFDVGQYEKAAQIIGGDLEKFGIDSAAFASKPKEAQALLAKANAAMAAGNNDEVIAATLAARELFPMGMPSGLEKQAQVMEKQSQVGDDKYTQEQYDAIMEVANAKSPIDLKRATAKALAAGVQPAAAKAASMAGTTEAGLSTLKGEDTALVDTALSGMEALDAIGSSFKQLYGEGMPKGGYGAVFDYATESWPQAVEVAANIFLDTGKMGQYQRTVSLHAPKMVKILGSGESRLSDFDLKLFLGAIGSKWSDPSISYSMLQDAGKIMKMKVDLAAAKLEGDKKRILMALEKSTKDFEKKIGALDDKGALYDAGKAMVDNFGSEKSGAPRFGGSVERKMIHGFMLTFDDFASLYPEAPREKVQELWRKTK